MGGKERETDRRTREQIDRQKDRLQNVLQDNPHVLQVLVAQMM